ncbi:MAG: toprim domain-containing protein [Alicyclobacillaceae bacterium]|jgi:toprim domain protein|uniref:toprim domain-containing protein n=1 Tax=Alicyclobacillus sp. SP_1 TaxID=2942475 RepID=UPI0021579C5A|nr:toprim domain-containing protein [Alicyclobacillus sp. SP_1]MCY0887285.1 toprim domain-containing protein [Alicyclobacillaceae bacterium]
MTRPSAPVGEKVIIVEGKTDCQRIQQLLRERVRILCTRGTLSYEKLEEEIVPLQQEDVYILVDADAPGDKLRQQLRRELPNARHLYTRRMYREVARTPLEYLLKILAEAHFAVAEPDGVCFRRDI